MHKKPVCICAICYLSRTLTADELGHVYQIKKILKLVPIYRVRAYQVLQYQPAHNYAPAGGHGNAPSAGLCPW